MARIVKPIEMANVSMMVRDRPVNNKSSNEVLYDMQKYMLYKSICYTKVHVIQ